MPTVAWTIPPTQTRKHPRKLDPTVCSTRQGNGQRSKRGLGHTRDDLTAAVEGGFLPILRSVPDFREYFLVAAGEGVASVSVFVDQARAEESTRQAADWVYQNLAGFFTGAPAVTTGSVWLHDVGEAMVGTSAP